MKNTGQLPKYLVQNHHEGIIDRCTFDRVQEEISRRAGTRSASKKNCVSGLSKYSSKFALTNLLVCGECGTSYRRCTWTKNGDKKIVWRCISRLDYGTKYCKKSPTLEENRIHRAILAAINGAMGQREDLITLVISSVKTICTDNSDLESSEAVRLHICELEAKYAKLMDDVLQNDTFAVHNAEIKMLNDELAALRGKYELLVEHKNGNLHAQKHAANIAEKLQTVPAEMMEWSDTVIRQIVSEVRVLNANTLEIVLKSGAKLVQDMGV